ncbi:dipeptide epimerase [Fimbriiglobus ruber]|uniref:Dipeptide epimerase n=1 Tax=Fimbriiglobus ruber TaxID=1908690 RepID=A0A225DW89_9BACT|nr:dipeptide epimerase [Fimbriiglobus ruber]OWK43824.1 Muconate cycloisomerase [Fimbriiglobus ruber]
MQIVALEAFHVRIPLRRPVKHASHTRTETDNVLVRCGLSDGSVGWGEGVPRDYVTGETIDSALELLKTSDLPRQLESCSDFERAVQFAGRLRLNPVPGDDRLCQGNAARCAVELAVLDAYGRAFGESLVHVTKFVAPDLYEPRERVQYSGVILSAKGWKARAYAVGQRLYGFRQLKVKVGIAGQDDAARLRAIRNWAGRAMDLRVDANEAWSPAEVADKIRALEPFGITSVEQPVRHEDVAALAAVRQQVKVSIMLDESLCSEVDAERAIGGGWCDLFNLRLSKCGGLIPALRLAALAGKHGLGYQLGCQVGETGILSAAGRQFATSVKGIRALEGSYDRRLVYDWLTTEDITFGRGGWAPTLTGCGLGVTVEPARVESVTVRREVLLG